MRYMKLSWTEIGVIGCIASIFAIIAVTCLAGFLGLEGIQYSDGSRSGVIQKLSKKGLIWKTWEGELNLGYTEATTDAEGRQTIAPAIFYFSVSSDDVAKTLKEAEKHGRRVTIDYRQYLFRGYKYGGTSYDVTGIPEKASAEKQ